MAEGAGAGGGDEFGGAEFAAVCSFLSQFGPLCALEPVHIRDLQRQLEDSQRVPDTLRDLHIKLLRRALKSVHADRWERGIIKFCHQSGNHKEAWEVERFGYKKASIQVKIKILKVLLEYQFTCHTKFKNAVNAMKSSDLRLNPVGRDKGGRVYWLHTDFDANLRLYREDQDEETWILISQDREGLVKVINQLKNGEEDAVEESFLNEDSNSAEFPSDTKIKKSDDNEDSNEEFLSPESESENESEKEPSNGKENELSALSKEDSGANEEPILKNTNEDFTKLKDNKTETEIKQLVDESDSIKNKNGEVSTHNEVTKDLNENPDNNSNNVECANTSEELSEKSSDIIKENVDETVGLAIEEPMMLVTGEGNGADCEGVWDEISEPVMFIWGMGSGVVCDGGNPGQVTAEMIQSEKNNRPTEDLNSKKSGNDSTNNGEVSSDIDSNEKDILENCSDPLQNETLHLPVTKRFLQENADDKASDQKQVETTPKKPCIWNVESIVKKCENSDNISPEKDVSVSSIRKETDSQSEEISLSDRQSNSEDVDQPSCLTKSKDGNDIEQSNTKIETTTQLEKKQEQDVCNKKNIVEKRKSSVSSEDDKRNKTLNALDKTLSPVKKTAGKTRPRARSKATVEILCKPDPESLPPKKLRLDSSTDDCDKDGVEKCPLVEQQSPKDSKESDINSTKTESPINKVVKTNSIDEDHTNNDKADLDDSGIVPKKCKVDVDNEKDKIDEEIVVNKADLKDEVPATKRDLKKVGKGRFGKRRILKKPIPQAQNPLESDSDTNLGLIANKHKLEVGDGKQNASDKKNLKRGLHPEKRKRTRNKVESVSEEENEESGVGKRLKIKPKKVLLSTRKKVEEKLNNMKDSSEDSEEPDATPKKGKPKRTSSPKKESKQKSGKKLKKSLGTGGKSSKKTDAADDDDNSPVRQSRRIAQLKIREEAERRQMEEVALRELKMKHNKKVVSEDGEEWRASGHSSGSEEGNKWRRKVKKSDKWPQSDSSAPASESDTDEPLFERVYEEPDLVFKSDHEFSPESDLEDEDYEPLKRARTLKEVVVSEAVGFCVKCGRGDHPEWILLCDKCDAGYHASCLKPLLFLIPDGDWYCPPCQHERLIQALEVQLLKYDELAVVAEVERSKRKSLEEKAKAEKDAENKSDEEESSSEWSSSDDGVVYRLRERRQLPVSLRAQEYDRLMSSAIKEEYKEPSSTAGNQGRGKDISTIIEAAEEEKQKAEMEAAVQSGVSLSDTKKNKPRRPRRKPRKLNSLDVLSEDDDEIDEDFKEAGYDTSSESISSDADADTNSDGRSSDSLPIRRSGREGKKSRKKIVESPELKKKKGLFDETSSESSGAKDWSNKKKGSTKKKYDKSSPKKSRTKRKKGLKQYDVEGNVIKPRIKYGGLSGSEGSNDWSPKHRTRQKKINYTEMPNTESEDEMHKPSGKHMPDSSDEFKISESDGSSDSDAGKKGDQGQEGEKDISFEQAERVNALKALVNKTAVVPLHKLPEEVTKAKTEALEAQLRAGQAAGTPGTKTARGKGSRGGRGSRGPRGGGRSGKTPAPSSSGVAGTPGANADPTDETLSKLVGVKIKDLSQTTDGPLKPNQIEREKKRMEREARLAEKEARKMDRIKKKEERDQAKEQKAKEREEKKLAKVALQESKKSKKDKFEGLQVPIPIAGYSSPGMRPSNPRPMGPDMVRMGMPMNPQYADFQRMRHPSEHLSYPGPRGPGAPAGTPPPPPRLQVRPELRAMRPDLANVRAAPPQQYHPAHRQHQPHLMQLDERRTEREGTLSVAGSPQPFKPATDPPSIITRMPHMLPSQYRGPVMYGSASPYGPPRGPPQHMAMYMHQAHPLDPSPSGGHIVNRHPFSGPGGGYYPQMRGYPPRFPQHQGHPHTQGQQQANMQGPPHHMTPPPGHPANQSIPHPTVQTPGHPSNQPPGHSTGQPLSQQPSHSQPSESTPPPRDDMPKIKSEIKSEPEFLRDSGSPSSSPAHRSSPLQEEQLRHPKIKNMDKDRPLARARTVTTATRYPQGPYAPQYGPYGPYAPPSSGPQPENYSTMNPMQHPPRSVHSTPPPPHHMVPSPMSHHPGLQGSHHPGPHQSGPHQSGPHHPGNHHPGPHHSGPHHPGPPGAHHTGPPGPHHGGSAVPHHALHHPPLPQHTAAATSHHAGPHQQPPAAVARHSIPPQSPHRSAPHQGPPPLIPHHTGTTPLPHPPPSPMTAMRSTPPTQPTSGPSIVHQTSETLHNHSQILKPSQSDSVNLVAHNRLHSPPPTIQRLGPTFANNSAAESNRNGAPEQPGVLMESSVPSGTHLTPMEPKAIPLVKSENNATDGLEVIPNRSPPMEDAQRFEPQENRPPQGEEGGVFGGLVSYFSSQQEDDIDG